MASPFQVVWREDGDATVLARITARDGTGAATGVDGEGNFLKQADITSISCAIFDLDGDDINTAISTPTVTVATHVLDTPVTTAVLWTKDTTGYNFLHDLKGTEFPTGGSRYSVEYKVTLSGGAIFHGVYEGQARPIRTS